MTIPSFQRKILTWYAANKRDLPWKHARDPFRILVSEIMLQQTQVSRVLPKYQEFLEKFPTVQALAEASDRQLLRTWSGLGYWRRAHYLKQAAQEIVKTHRGKFPRDIKALQTLPGFGPYTAGAVACFAFNSSEAFLDTNIRRVYLHFFFPGQHQVSDQQILAIAQSAVWKKDPRTWHYALLDYGALELPRKGINTRSRHYHRQTPFENSFRAFRSQVVKQILARPQNKIAHASLTAFLKKELAKSNSPYRPQAVIESLLKDELIKKSARHYSL